MEESKTEKLEKYLFYCALAGWICCLFLSFLFVLFKFYQ